MVNNIENVAKELRDEVGDGDNFDMSNMTSRILNSIQPEHLQQFSQNLQSDGGGNILNNLQSVYSMMSGLAQQNLEG